MTHINPTPTPEWTAVLLDAAAIQTYVFASNRLKENVGASHIVAHELYGDLLDDCLAEVVGDPRHIAKDWELGGPLALATQTDLLAEIGYIGGGKALLIFREAQTARHFLRAYSQAVLLTYPGLRLIAACDSVSTEELHSDYGRFRGRLEDEMKHQKHAGQRTLLVHKPGIVTDCPYSNEAAEVPPIQESQEGEHPWTGSGTQSRNAAAPRNHLLLRERLRHTSGGESLGERFTYTLELGELGQDREKGYIAVVHIDGNGIGAQFKACTSLAEIRKLSVQVRDAAQGAMDDLINELMLLLVSGGALTDAITLAEDDQALILPIRPLLVGGDDVVFVCEGRLGVFLAERYIQHFQAHMRGHGFADACACAGVAIVKTKYPFYRAYELAKDLMDQAKRKSRAQEGSSWLSFLVSSAGFNGSLKEVLSQQYMLGDIRLYAGPYCLESAAFRHLKEGAVHFAKSWPRNKVMELREALTWSADAQTYLMESLKERGLALPHEGKTEPARLDKHAGAYMDMIELMTFYPQELLKCN